ncbi:MAG: hypothetical protein KatS3mg108_1322 [Isosphaeraceae bacterium]|jgi:hypothetical protein|nr:MAG: hypothetical protein KatS3mg108_1322 [Isosphaeraceae bacterium]
MKLRGIVRSSSLQETTEGQLELRLDLQGVGPAQPRTVVVPQDVLIREAWLDPDEAVGRGIEAEVALADDGRWRVVTLVLGPSRVLRRPDET